MDDAELIREAARAREKAHAPYSGAMVGACVETGSGETYSACNVENASYGLTICAERAAIFAAVAAGHKRIGKVAISAQGLENPMPCGACLQVMREFAVERVLVDRGDDGIDSYDFAELLPRPFKL
jgi:cytidine deaminase